MAPPPHGSGVSSAVVAGSGVAAGGATPAACDEKPDASERGRALASLADGKGRATIRLFEAAIRARPEDLASQALLIAATARQERFSLESENALANVRPIDLEPPTKASFAANGVDPRPGAADVKLKKASEAKNLIVDDADWFKKHDLKNPWVRPGPSDVPEHLPRLLFGGRINQLFDHGDHQIGVYGASLVVAAEGKAPLVFTLKQSVGAAIRFAQLVGTTLVVAMNTFAALQPESIVAAYDARSGALRWSSEPGVTTAETFAVTRDHLVTGSGGSAAPDFVWLLDLVTGKTLSKLPVKTAATYLLPKGDRVFVRAYDVDYEFSFSSSPAPALAPVLPDAIAKDRALSEASRCALGAAVAATDARDVPRLKEAIRALATARTDRTISSSFEGALRFLEQQAKIPALDLTVSAPVRLPEPSWDQQTVTPAQPSPPPDAKPKLVKTKSASANPSALIMRRGTYHPSKPWPIAPVEQGALPPGARRDIPTHYGLESLGAIIPSEDRLLLVYGGRYVAITKDTKTEAVFDLESFRHPPKVNPQWKEFAVGDVTFALTSGDVLYVANGGGSYAREMFGKKAFMSAISISTKKLLWRSAPLVHGGGPFALWKEYLVTGYGFTDEPDNLFLIRRDNGVTAAKLPLDSGPDEILVTGDVANVTAYSHTYEIALSR